MSSPAAEPALLELVATSAAEGERERALPADVVAALRGAGVFRLLVPASIGGGEAHPAELCATVEAIAAASQAPGVLGRRQRSQGNGRTVILPGRELV